MVSPQNPIWVYIYLFIYLFIYLLYKSYIKHRKKNRKIDRKEQSTRTQITRNVREVTNRERVRQTYQSVSIDSPALDQLFVPGQQSNAYKHTIQQYHVRTELLQSKSSTEQEYRYAQRSILRPTGELSLHTLHFRRTLLFGIWELLSSAFVVPMKEFHFAHTGCGQIK